MLPLSSGVRLPGPMRYSTIRNHLKPYVIVARRRTTINHAFAAAVAPSDEYDEQRIRAAVAMLGCHRRLKTDPLSPK